MNRTIKFRGKSVDNGEWLYGNLIQRIGRFPGIMFDYEHGGKICYAEQPVDPDTIGQFTGLLDRVGAPVYEGDIVRITSLTGVVTWNPFATCFYIDTEGKTPNMNTTHTPLGDMWKSHRQELIIVGNATDNPELTEKV